MVDCRTLEAIYDGVMEGQSVYALLMGPRPGGEGMHSCRGVLALADPLGWHTVVTQWGPLVRSRERFRIEIWIIHDDTPIAPMLAAAAFPSGEGA